MSDFKPSPEIFKFIYSVSEGALYMDCIVTVPLPALIDLAAASLNYDPLTSTAEKKYDPVNDPTQIAPHNFKDGFKVKIIPRVTVPYTPNDKEGFKTALRKTMASFYTLKSTVNPVIDAPGTGGSGGNTIAKNKDIDIT